MNSVTDIHFFFQQKGTHLQHRKGLKRFLIDLVKREGRKTASLNIIFCSDDHLLDINRQFLQHNDYTDIITFDLSSNRKEAITAELYISVQRVRENATIFNTTIKRELHRVIFHGLLHLCGYGDKKPIHVKKMREREEFYLNKYFKA
jgi:probable rRNA maturation factor